MRRLIAIAFLVVGLFQILVFALLILFRGRWAAVPLTLSIVMETCLLRCVLSPSSRKVQLTAWILTFLTWSLYHLLVLAHWIQSERWFTAVAIVAWIGAGAMFVLCKRQTV
jgi:hypothetical protein